MDSVREQEKLEARKLFDAKRAVESPASSARFVRHGFARNISFAIQFVIIATLLTYALLEISSTMNCATSYLLI